MLARRRLPEMSFEDYLVWEAKQPEKWELADGRPVLRSARWHYDPATGMASATVAHNRISANLIVALGTRLRGRPCWASPSDLKTRSREKSARYPDVTVECGTPAANSLISAEPRVIFEVLSPSNSFPDLLRLLDDYQAVPSIQQVVYVEQGRPSVLSWERSGALWPRTNLDGIEATLALPALGLELPLAEIYEGLSFEAPAA